MRARARTRASFTGLWPDECLLWKEGRVSGLHFLWMLGLEEDRVRFQNLLTNQSFTVTLERYQPEAPVISVYPPIRRLADIYLASWGKETAKAPANGTG
jgi:hypothetical protein